MRTLLPKVLIPFSGGGRCLIERRLSAAPTHLRKSNPHYDQQQKERRNYSKNVPTLHNYHDHGHKYLTRVWAALLAFFLVKCEDNSAETKTEQLSWEEEYMVLMGDLKKPRKRISDEYNEKKAADSKPCTPSYPRAEGKQQGFEDLEDEQTDSFWKDVPSSKYLPMRPVSEAAVIEKADRLYVNNDIKGLYIFLNPFQESQNADIIWRLARATCDYAKNTQDTEDRKKCMYKAFGFAKSALDLDRNNFACHKWYGIMLDYIGDYEGTAKRISNAYEVKQRFLDAIRLKPDDATSIHLLGYWCFVFADLSWVQRKLASTIFAKPPDSSYHEALRYFEDAEKVDPNFYLMNKLMIGKTYFRLKDFDKAKTYLTEVKNTPIKTADDRKAHEEASQLLNKL